MAPSMRQPLARLLLPQLDRAPAHGHMGTWGMQSGYDVLSGRAPERRRAPLACCFRSLCQSPSTSLKVAVANAIRKRSETDSAVRQVLDEPSNEILQERFKVACQQDHRATLLRLMEFENGRICKCSARVRDDVICQRANSIEGSLKVSECLSHCASPSFLVAGNSTSSRRAALSRSSNRSLDRLFRKLDAILYRRFAIRACRDSASKLLIILI